MSQIALVTNKHNDNVAIGMVAKLLEPSANRLVCTVLGDVIDEQSSNRATVVSVRKDVVG